MRWPLLVFTCLTIAVSAGCDSESSVGAATAPTTRTSEEASNFDRGSCGAITGLVTWTGSVPEAAQAFHMFRRIDGSGFDPRTVPYANTPRIDRFTRGFGGVVVYLREMNPAKARPWDLPPVKVEFRDAQLVVQQGNRLARTGFVRRGEPVELRSAEPYLHVLRGRGADFLALAFPEPNQPLTRTFDSCGRVELTSADGCYWQSVELFVCDHPYYAVTDMDGRFHFKSVPAGEYDLVAWHPNWIVVHTERNPESGLPSRLIYAPPLRSSRPVMVNPGRTTLANLTLPN